MSPLRVTTVADGVARISWDPEEHLDVVRRELATALMTHARVEALLEPGDERAHRVATRVGMHREGLMRGVTVDGATVDRVVYARLATDAPLDDPTSFRAILNSFLPRKRAIAQLLIRATPDASAGLDEERVLLCGLTYKRDWDLPGGVVEVGESPHVAVGREIQEELALELPVGPLLLTDWLPAWGGWDDALCLVFDGGVHDVSLVDGVVKQAHEIASVAFCTLAEVDQRATDFTARRIRAALAAARGDGPVYSESGRV